MTLRAYKNRRDASEPEIVKALQAAGCSVTRMDKPVDLLVGFRGTTHLVECKSGKEKLNESQSDFVQKWRGGPVFIIRDTDGALETIKLWSAIARRAA